MESTNATRRGAAGHRGPPLGPVALAYTALFMASIVVLTATTDGGYPLPGAAAGEVHSFFLANRAEVQVAAMLQFGSAFPLVVYAATVASRLHHLGARVAGSTIALAGGVLAAALTIVSALINATATDGGVAIAQVLHHLVHVTGGVGVVAPAGLLVAGIAVPSIAFAYLPRWLAWAGLSIAVVCELSTLTLVFESLTPLLPIGRFGGMVFLISAGFVLPTRSRSRR